MWTVSPQVWPSGGASPDPPEPAWPLAGAVLLAGAAALFRLAERTLGPRERRNAWTPWLVLLGGGCMAGAVAIELLGHWQMGLRPTDNSYGAMVYMAALLTGQLAFAIVIMALYTMARHFAGKLDTVRRGTLENTALLVYYTAAQGLLGLLLIHVFPRVMG
jgi:cytochrome c oxidase subunit I+III